MEEEFDSSVTDKTPLMVRGLMVRGEQRRGIKPELCTATGEGLTRGKVNEVAKFRVHVPKEAGVANLRVEIIGIYKPPDIKILNNKDGSMDVTYQPKAPGQYKIDCSFGGVPIKGSPFFATVEGEVACNPLLVRASGEALTKPIPCGQRSVITITAKEGAGLGPLRGRLIGPLAEEFHLQAISQEVCEASFLPKANGFYKLHIRWGNGDYDKCQIPGSPFTITVGNTLNVSEYRSRQFSTGHQSQPTTSPFNVNVTGPINNDPSKVKVTGDGLSGGQVGEPIKLFVSADVGSGPGPLGVKLIGPSKPSIVADDSSEEGVEVTINCLDPGEYQMMVKWGEEEIPGSPFVIPVGGKGRDIKPELCTATGEGLTRGKVNEVAKFRVHIPKEAGVASLRVVIIGKYKPPVIKILNNKDGSMDVTYQPKAPGQYKIDCNFGDLPIKGSPFFATVEGELACNPLLVTASGEALTKPIPCGQQSVITITAEEGAGLGPLRGRWSGPLTAEFHLQAISQEVYEVSFLPKANGFYKVHFMWGNGDDDKCQIPGSPFTIKVGHELDIPEYRRWQFSTGQQRQEEVCVICCNIL